MTVDGVTAILIGSYGGANRAQKVKPLIILLPFEVLVLPMCKF